MASVLVFVIALIQRRRLHSLAIRRMWRIKTRLPYFLDLVNLLMEAGSTFLNALREACREFSQQPVGEEFGRVLAELSMGRNRSAALESLRDRLQDDEVTSLVGAIIQGEEHGSPLVQVLRGQADFLRVKRTQRARNYRGRGGSADALPGDADHDGDRHRDPGPVRDGVRLGRVLPTSRPMPVSWQNNSPRRHRVTERATRIEPLPAPLSSRERGWGEGLRPVASILSSQPIRGAFTPRWPSIPFLRPNGPCVPPARASGPGRRL